MSLHILGIPRFKFLQDAGCQPRINNVFCITSHDLRAVHFHSAPLPIPKSKCLGLLDNQWPRRLVRASQMQKEILEADEGNFQMHGLPGSPDDLLQRFEEKDGAFDKETNYPVVVLDAGHAA